MNKTTTVLKWCGGVVISIPLLVLFVFLFIQTPLGKKVLVALLENHIHTAPGITLSISKITGTVPTNMQVKALHLSDANGEWLRMENVGIQWQLASMLKGYFYFPSLTADNIIWQRLPTIHPIEKKIPKSFSLSALRVPPIVIDHIEAKRIEIQETVTGTSSVLALSGNISTQMGTQDVSTKLGLKTLEGVETRFTSTLDKKGEQFALNGVLHEDGGGIISSLLSLPENTGLTANLDASGTMVTWSGAISASTPTASLLNTKLSGSYTKGIKLKAEGMVQLPLAVIPPTLQNTLQPETSFLFDGHYRQDGILAINKAIITNNYTELSLTGTLEEHTQQLNTQFTLTQHNLSVLSQLAKRPLAGSAVVTGTTSGSLQNIFSADMTIETKELQIEKMQIAEAILQGKLVLKDFAQNQYPEFSFTGQGKTGDMVFVSSKKNSPFPHPTLSQGERDKTRKVFSSESENIKNNPLPLGEGRVRESTLHAPPKQQVLSPLYLTYKISGTHNGNIAIEQASLTSDSIIITANGNIDLADSYIDVESHVDIPQLQTFVAPVSGAARMQLGTKGKFDSINLSLDGSMHDLAGLPPAIATTIGHDVTLTGKGTLAGQELAVSELTLQTPHASAQAHGAINFSSKQLQAVFDTQLPALDTLRPDFTGALTIHGTLDGIYANPTLKAGISLADAQFYQLAIPSASATVEAQKLFTTPEGKVQAVLHDSQGKQLDFSSRFAFTNNSLSVPDIALAAEGITAGGDIHVTMAPLLLKGKVTGQIDTIAGLASFFGQKAAGTGNFSASFTPAGRKQQASLSVQMQHITSPIIAADTVSLTASSSDLFALSGIDAAMEWQGISSNTYNVDRLQGKIAGDREVLHFSASSNGYALASYTIATKGTLKLLPQEQQLEIQELTGIYGTHNIALHNPVQLQKKGTALHLSSAMLTAGDGTLKAEGSITPTKVDIRSTIAHLPLTILPFDVFAQTQGMVEGTLSLTGNPQQPNGMVSLHIRGFKPDMLGEQEKNTPALDANIESQLNHNRSTSHITITDTTNSNATGILTMPVALSLSPFQFNTSGTIEGEFNLGVHIGGLSPFLMPAGQSIAGQLTGKLQLSGTMVAPRMTGTAQLTGGRYENTSSGTVLHNVAIDLNASGNRLEFIKATANDGSKGTVSGNGWIELSTERGFPLSLSFTFDKAQLLRQDDVSGIASGTIETDGTLLAPALKGNLTLEQMEINIPEKFATYVPELTVTEINRPLSLATKGEKPFFAEATPIALNIILDAPRQVYLRGRGLETELQGKLVIQGTSKAPQINGQLQSVRGRYEVLGTTFTITEGHMEFEGTIPPSPFLRISGEARTKDIIAEGTLSGPILSPTLSLSSTPSLPSDELLARLLFGEELANISPFQAIQLADSLKNLSGKSPGGFNVLGNAREVLGLDDLRIGGTPGETAGPTVAAGKHISDKVYLQVERGIADGSGKVGVEVEITPEISIETEAGQDTRSGVLLNWKKDY